MDKKTGGGDFIKALRKNVPPIEQFYEIRENTNNILDNTKKIKGLYEPVITPVTNKIVKIPCNTAKLYKSMICTPSGLITGFLDKKSLAHNIINLPCYTAELYKDNMCDPPHIISKSINKLKNIVHIGGARYKNHHYDTIYDPIRKRHYPILSVRGQAVIKGYLDSLMYTNS